MAPSTWLLLCCLMLTRYVQESVQLRIKNITVPAVVKHGIESVILDCDYDLENTSHEGLVVKWFKDEVTLVYQWILVDKHQASDEFEKYVDLKYKASDDPKTMYRAIRFINPGVELTGNYMCVISTFKDEVTQSSNMVIYSTEDKFDLELSKKNQDNKGSVEVTCTAGGLFPKPTLDISIGNLENINDDVNFVERDDFKFDVLSRVTVDDEDLPDNAVVKCTLGIPAANYTVFQETIYYPGPPLTTTSIPMSKTLRKMEIQAPYDTLADSGNDDAGGNSATVHSSSLTFLMGQLLIFAAVIF